MPTQPDRSRPDGLPAVLRSPLSPVAADLLASRIPARMAWSAPDGPHVVPIWFEWTGDRLEVVTFVGAAKLRDIADGSTVAVVIDTDAFPYRSLKLRGPVELSTTSGTAAAYRRAARRYLGPELADRWLRFLDGGDQVVISIRPRWAKLADMATDSPFFTATSEGDP